MSPHNILQGNEVEANEHGGEAVEESSVDQVSQCQNCGDLKVARYYAGATAEAPTEEHCMMDLGVDIMLCLCVALWALVPASCGILRLSFIRT